MNKTQAKNYVQKLFIKGLIQNPAKSVERSPYVRPQIILDNEYIGENSDPFPDNSMSRKKGAKLPRAQAEAVNNDLSGSFLLHICSSPATRDAQHLPPWLQLPQGWGSTRDTSHGDDANLAPHLPFHPRGSWERQVMDVEG